MARRRSRERGQGLTPAEVREERLLGAAAPSTGQEAMAWAIEQSRLRAEERLNALGLEWVDGVARSLTIYLSPMARELYSVTNIPFGQSVFWEADNRGEAKYLVGGIPASYFRSSSEAQAASRLLRQKRAAENVSEIPRTLGQVYQIGTCYHCYPCEIAFHSFDLADRLSKVIIARRARNDDDIELMDLIAELHMPFEYANFLDTVQRAEATAEAEAAFVEGAGPGTELTASHDARLAPRHVWQPVEQLCRKLVAAKSAIAFPTQYAKAEMKGRGDEMFAVSAVLAVRSLLTQLFFPPSAATVGILDGRPDVRSLYDLSDVYGKLTHFAAWMSYPSYDDLVALHDAISLAVVGTPVANNWGADPFPALTAARQKLGYEGDTVYRKIRREGEP